MSAFATQETDGKRVGTTAIGATGGAVGGYGVGKAIAAIIIHFFPELADIAWAVEFLFEAILVGIGGIVVGKYTPTNMAKIMTEFVQPRPTSEVTPPQANMTVEAETVVVEEHPEKTADAEDSSEVEILEHR